MTVKKAEKKFVVHAPTSDAPFYRIERRLSYNARHNCLAVFGPLFAHRVKGRSKRGWTTPKGKA
jgi:hypothetical protein